MFVLFKGAGNKFRVGEADNWTAAEAHGKTTGEEVISVASSKESIENLRANQSARFPEKTQA